MKKILWTAFAAAFLVLCYWGYKFNSNLNNDKSSITIGIMLPVTGNTSTFGQAYRNGFLLAVHDVLYGTKYNYNIVIEDTADNLKTAPVLA
ncbi:MAG: hypothetical protein LBL47_05085, partial [Lactobacillus sp.]|nr:hypothetical protein [Lactobacillus sp.]